VLAPRRRTRREGPSSTGAPPSAQGWWLGPSRAAPDGAGLCAGRHHRSTQPPAAGRSAKPRTESTRSLPPGHAASAQGSPPKASRTPSAFPRHGTATAPGPSAREGTRAAAGGRGTGGVCERPWAQQLSSPGLGDRFPTEGKQAVGAE